MTSVTTVEKKVFNHLFFQPHGEQTLNLVHLNCSYRQPRLVSGTYMHSSILRLQISEATESYIQSKG